MAFNRFVNLHHQAPRLQQRPNDPLILRLFFVPKRAANAVFEADNEANNSGISAGAISVGHPDLIASISSLPATAVSGSTITLGGRIENRGTAVALGSWLDRAYLSTDAVLNQNNTLLGELAHAGPLAAGGGYDVSFNVPLPVDASGIRYLLLVGDATNQVNELADAREVLQLDVHHRFLSAFVHPFSEAVTESVYHPIYRGDWPIEDHYAEELVLLYACTFAIDELRDLERMTRREPTAVFTRWDEVRTELEIAEAQIAHFWAPGRAPYAFDRIHEANQRVFDAYDAQHAAGAPLTRPDIPDPRRLLDKEIR